MVFNLINDQCIVQICKCRYDMIIRIIRWFALGFGVGHFSNPISDEVQDLKTQDILFLTCLTRRLEGTTTSTNPPSRWVATLSWTMPTSISEALTRCLLQHCGSSALEQQVPLQMLWFNQATLCCLPHRHLARVETVQPPSPRKLEVMVSRTICGCLPVQAVAVTFPFPFLLIHDLNLNCHHWHAAHWKIGWVVLKLWRRRRR